MFCIPFLIFVLSCEKNPTEIKSGLSITEHTYDWYIDTLQAPSNVFQFIKEDIWGTDENNVWIVGHSDLVQHQIWHWDGVEWSDDYHRFPGHRPSFTSIYGFSENDLWIVGDENVLDYPDKYYRSFIAHYNGSEWHHFENIKEPICLNIWGYNSSEVYVGCDSGLVLYYNGSTWEKQSTNTNAYINDIKGTSDGNLFAIGYKVEQYPSVSYTYFFFQQLNNKWTVIDSFGYNSNDRDYLFGSHLWISPENRFYSSGKGGLFEKIDSSWSHLFESNIFSIFGIKDNNIFAGGWANTLYHFNGKDWHLYDNIINNDTHIYDIWANDKNVFLMTSSPWIMYRGVLRE